MPIPCECEIDWKYIDRNKQLILYLLFIESDLDTPFNQMFDCQLVEYYFKYKSNQIKYIICHDDFKQSNKKNHSRLSKV